jgi:hypothetical protein
MFQWTFSTHKEHSPQWYVVAIVAVLSLVLYGITQELYLMSIVSVLFAGVYMFMENNAENATTVTVDARQIAIGKLIYEMRNIDTFALISLANTPTYLRISQKKRFSPKLDIPLTDAVDAYELREFLLQYLTEDTDAQFSNSDAIIHAMKL